MRKDNRVNKILITILVVTFIIGLLEFAFAKGRIRQPQIEKRIAYINRISKSKSKELQRKFTVVRDLDYKKSAIKNTIDDYNNKLLTANSELRKVTYSKKKVWAEFKTVQDYLKKIKEECKELERQFRGNKVSCP